MTKPATRKGRSAASASADSAAAAASSLKRDKGTWTKSSCSKRMLTSLRNDGLIPEDTSQVRIPGAEVIPRPGPNEWVCFVDFVNRGFSFPVHNFLRALMHVYRVQLHDFTPNGLLHIACFFVLCECFLGVAPHFGLFRRIFNVKRQHSTKGPGGFGVQARPDASTSRSTS